MALEPISANWQHYIRQDKYREALYTTVYSTTIIGANTTFLQIDRRCTPFSNIFSASPIFPHITDNLGSSGGKTFLQNPRWWPFNLKKNVQRPNT
jgi:hypothetical protein